MLNNHYTHRTTKWLEVLKFFERDHNAAVLLMKEMLWRADQGLLGFIESPGVPKSADEVINDIIKELKVLGR